MLGALKAARVKLLLDVRAVRVTQAPGLGGSRQAALDQAGIGYVHLQGLGTPRPGR